MYNLQKAKEEIDAVAKHTTDLTEYVISIGETLQTLSASLEGKLEGIRRELHGLMEGKLNEVRQAVLGSDEPLLETSAIADLGAKLSALKSHRSILAMHETPRESSAPDMAGQSHAEAPASLADQSHDTGVWHGQASEPLRTNDEDVIVQDEADSASGLHQPTSDHPHDAQRFN